MIPAGGLERAAFASASAFRFAASAPDIDQVIFPQNILCVALSQLPPGAVNTIGPKCPTLSLPFAVKANSFVSPFFIACGGRHSPVPIQPPSGLKVCIATVTFSLGPRFFLSVTFTRKPESGATASGVSTLSQSSSWTAA